MKNNKRLLVVGGTGRDVGKTEFICQLLKKISVTHEVYALKVSAIFPDEDLFHGSHDESESRLHLYEELNASTTKDTSRMLRAGAKKVFYLRSDDAGILDGYRNFVNQIPPKAIVICESNSLGQFIKPGISIVVKALHKPIKERAIVLLESANLVVNSDCISGFPELESVCYSETGGWKLQSKTEVNFD
ncbi:hypothetical protein [Desulforhopalus sp. IMCC35007]|uniref:hypothetical protein n=1 Tax=Desulforhopalus sp. IMCC35007 TaxID=2569543 RepID=UPI0010AE89EC|nr:hypothetical protein [Desulforhopalus sp. IMCC35007]TKB10421.1 hypothetical protein FCL48_07715 [Desulforhopalus sp. IMCC35007]